MSNTTEVKIEPIGIDSITISISIYGSLLVAGWVYFECRREVNRMAYATRHRSPETKTPYVDEAYGWFKWLRPVWSISDEDLVRYCGCDTLMFVRFQKLGLKIATLGILFSFVLIPVYATGGAQTKDLDRWTLANIDNGSPRLYALIVISFALSLATMYLVRDEYLVYKKLRYEVLKKFDAHQYSILIDDLPSNLQSNVALKHYMEDLFPNQVLTVSVAMSLEHLENDVMKRTKVLSKLESAIAKHEKMGKRPTHRGGMCLGKPVDSIEFYEGKLDELNIHIQKTVQDFNTKRGKIEMDEQTAFSHENVMIQEQRDGSEGYPEEMIDNEEATESSIMRKSGFVTFKTLKAAQMAQQTLQMESPYSIVVTSAPPLEDICWSNIGKSTKVKDSLTMISTMNSFLIVFFWTIPTTAVSTFSRVSNLKQNFDFLQSFPDWADYVLEQISPLLLVVMASLAGIIFGILSEKEGHPSTSSVQASLFTKLAWFNIVQTFFVATISGSIISEMREYVEHPDQIPERLAKIIPGQAGVFVMFIIIKTGTSILELLRVVPRIIGKLHELFAPQLTEEQRTSPWLGLYPLSCPETFDQSEELVNQFFIFMLILVYTPIYPLISYFGAVYFLVMGTTFRRQVLFVYDPYPNSFGVFWPKLYDFIITGLVVSQLTLIGLLGLKGSPAVAAVFLLPGITWYYNREMKRLCEEPSKYLPLSECIPVDNERKCYDNDAWALMDGAFNQPAMKEEEPIIPKQGNDDESDV